MATFYVTGSVGVNYDGANMYPDTSQLHTVVDNYANYEKSLKDISASLISIDTAFTNNVNLTEDYLAVDVDFSAAAARGTTTHRVFNVVGLVRMKILPVCTTNLAGSVNTAVIAFGTADAVSGWIGGTSTDIVDAGEMWLDSAPTETNLPYASAVVDRVVFSQAVGYEIITASASAGVITFHCWWTPLDENGVVTAGNLSTLA